MVAWLGLVVALLVVDVLLWITEQRPLLRLRRLALRVVCLTRGHAVGVVPVGYAHPYYHRTIKRRVCSRCNAEYEVAHDA